MPRKSVLNTTKTSKVQPEVHLFILWEKARSHEKEILEDIKANFSVLRIYEVTWSNSKFPENLSRFYGTSLPPNSRKEQHCGTGPFLAVVVEDVSPLYEVRTTTKGDQRVNTKLFESKALHREWTGGGHRVHGSNSVVEADHNLTMLFGKNAEDLRKEIGNKPSAKIVPLTKDLEGSEGWRDLPHLFYVLNSTIRYVALRNFESFPNDYYAKDHGDIDLMVENYHDACFTANAKPVFNAKHRVHNIVNINGEDVRFDFRSVGDGYYDSLWQEKILSERVLTKGNFYTPYSKDYFYALLYHALVQKPAIADDYAKKLSSAAAAIGANVGQNSFDKPTAIKTLAEFLKDNNYSFTQPRDKSVYVNTETVNAGVKMGIPFSKERMTPLRNHLKTLKSRSKHYYSKSRRIMNRNIRKILAKRYDNKS